MKAIKRSMNNGNDTVEGGADAPRCDFFGRVRKAVIPAAGMGTRFLPVTKSVPKELLPIVDKPVLQFVVEEAVASGIDDVLIVTGRGKTAIEQHFDLHSAMSLSLREAGKGDVAAQLDGIAGDCRVYFVRQARPLGLGDAIRTARAHVGKEPFAVLLGDSITDPAPGAAPGLRQLLDVHDRTGASVVAVQRVPRSDVMKYGIVDGQAEADDPALFRLRSLVEKPAPGRAPSDLAIQGRYVFTPQIFECIDQTAAGKGGEIQLTDAMNLLAGRQSMHALAWRARRYDTGDRVEYAKAFIEFALRRPELAGPLREYLQERLVADGPKRP